MNCRRWILEGLNEETLSFQSIVSKALTQKNVKLNSWLLIRIPGALSNRHLRNPSNSPVIG
jgi:hypothetical protein